MSEVPLKSISGWGRACRTRARELLSEDLETITRDAVLTRGLGRSYGDASLPAREGACVAASHLANRILAFDEANGVARVEAGLSLVDLHRSLLPRGWFTPVSPGTQFVTIGGMVAADVHGKNHHRAGTFGSHVLRLKLRLADGRIVECSPAASPDLFQATIGGCGLTGHILEAEFRLERVPSPWIWQKVERAADLGALLERLRQVSAEWPFTVSWVDCLPGSSFGRGVLIVGRWAERGEAGGAPPEKRAVRLPADFPEWVLNRTLGSLFNALYYRTHRLAEGPVHPESFFYPLDVVHEWNRVYGPSGFIQYQCVLPHSDGNDLVKRFMRRVVELDATCFLCVIKDFGGEGTGTLSFPRPGFTISLDMPFREGATQQIVDRLNETVIDSGGRIYLAKDGHSRPEHFRLMETRLAAFERVRSQWDPTRRLNSALSARLFGDRA